MVNTCSVAFCKTGYKKRINKVDEIPENYSVFSFPTKNPEINRLGIKFVNRKEWQPTKNSGVCSKHFEEKYLKNGVRTTLRWELNPVPSIYPNLDGVPKSILPSMPTRRKSPTRRTFSDQINEFKLQDEFKDFSQIDDSLCPEDGYQLQLHTGKAIFY